MKPVFSYACRIVIGSIQIVTKKSVLTNSVSPNHTIYSMLFDANALLVENNQHPKNMKDESPRKDIGFHGVIKKIVNQMKPVTIENQQFPFI